MSSCREVHGSMGTPEFDCNARLQDYHVITPVSWYASTLLKLTCFYVTFPYSAKNLCNIFIWLFSWFSLIDTGFWLLTWAYLVQICFDINMRSAFTVVFNHSKYVLWGTEYDNFNDMMVQLYQLDNWEHYRLLTAGSHIMEPKNMAVRWTKENDTKTAVPL